MKLKLIAVAAFAVTLLGCAADSKLTRSDTPVNDPSMSPALQIYKAAGIPGKMRDLPPGELAKYRGAEDPSRVPSTVLAAGTATTALPTPTGVNYGAGTAITAINFLFGGAHDQSYWNRVIFWMPESEYKALGENHILAMMWKFAEWAEPALPQGYTMSAESLSVGGKSLRVPVIKDAQGNFIAMVNASADRFVHESAPTVTGLGSGYTSKKGFYIYLNDRLTLDISEKKFEDFPFNPYEFLKRVSENMPSWAYFYVAPRDGLSAVPVILNGGREMYFEQPEIAQTVRPPAASPSKYPD